MKTKLVLGEDRIKLVRRTGVAAILISFALYVFVSALDCGGLRGQLFYWDITDTFMDYFNSISVIAFQNPYESNCMYPPLSQLIFLIFAKAIPLPVLNDNPHQYRMDQNALLSLLLFLAIPIAITVWALADYLKGDNTFKKIAIIAFLVSSPFMYVIERGNILIYAFAGALVFICYYDSDKKWQREAALIALAFSAGIKMYPAVLGLLLIRDKRWKDAVRCMVYGIFCVFAPFLAFGGLKAVMTMINSLQGNSGGFGPTDFNCKLSYDGIFDMIRVLWFGRPYGFAKGQMVAYGLGVLLVAAALLTKKRWKSVLYLSLVMIGVPAISFYYTGIFILLPFLMYIAGEEKEFGWRELLYFPAFVVFLSPFPITGELKTVSDINVNLQICSVCILYLTGWGLIDAGLDALARIRERKSPKAEVTA